MGLSELPGGDKAYRELIDVHTSLPLSAEEIHAYGMDEVRRNRGEIETLGRRLLGATSLADALQQLRTNPKLYFSTRQDVQAYAEEAVRRAREAIPRWFGRLPRSECKVLPIEAYEEKDSTIAYYRQPATTARGRARYYVNAYAPETRPRFEAQALAFHESIPGHHLQIAIAQEVQGLPASASIWA